MFVLEDGKEGIVDEEIQELGVQRERKTRDSNCVMSIKDEL